MKKTLLLLTIAFTSYNYAQNVNIPDANFKNALLAHGVTITGSDISKIDTNDDGEIQVTEAEAYAGKISVTNKNITSLTGIEVFINTTTIECNLNQLTTLDVSNNVALVLLDCTYNQLASLDISQNPSLYYLYCNHNQLTSLDVNVNTDLRYLYCNFNQLASLDVSSNINLTILGCGYNQLASLNIANGKNYLLNDFYAENNPNLTCIQIDNTPKSSWQKDAMASYSTDCASCIVNIPDANFKTYLVGNTAINTNGDTEIQCAEASAFNGTINCQSLSIANLAGIEAFVNLTKLYCSDNQLTSLNVTQNTALLELHSSSNQITSLDVSQNAALTVLNCSSNPLTNLDVTQNIGLTSLSCRISQLTNLDVTQNIGLTGLSCNDNQLTTLDVSQNTVLTSLNCSSNPLTNLNVTQNTVLEYLYCSSNQLTSLDVTHNTVLEYIYCHNNQLTSLDVTQVPNLSVFTCYNNQLTNLDVTQNTALIYLYCNNNQLTSLDVAQNTVLKELICSYNQLTSLDVAQNTALEYLANSSNQLMYLNIANGNNVSLTYFYTQNNPNLTCIQIDNGFTPPSNWNKDTTASYSTNCALSTNSFELSKQVTIYPNPAKDHFQVDLENNLELKTITVYNNLGQQILITNTPNVNTSALSKGMYYVEIVTNAGKANKKIIVE